MVLRGNTGTQFNIVTQKQRCFQLVKAPVELLRIWIENVGITQRLVANNKKLRPTRDPVVPIGGCIDSERVDGFAGSVRC